MLKVLDINVKMYVVLPVRGESPDGEGISF
jgi:hypothetical protein